MTHLDPKEALSTALDSIETGPDPEAGLARAREIVAGFASPTPAVSRPSREWMRDKIAADPDMETEVRPALSQPHSEK